MGGRAGGCYLIGKGLKGNQAHLSTQQENGLRILRIKDIEYGGDYIKLLSGYVNQKKFCGDTPYR
ncbi:hypothetical protein SO802_021995 [Lithocarpus litseifolius]|uniref:Homing endonuclease LAGLIDADG domain-containing protein n=1 Tax=Lithocarpus litseifolius TaxID=425828 RepID=A0AAW2CKS1_9ROSI